MKKTVLITILFALFLTLCPAAVFSEVSISLDIGDELTGKYTETDVSGYTNETYARADVAFTWEPIVITPWIKGVFQVEDDEMTGFFYSGLNFDFLIADPFNIFVGGEYYADIKLLENTEDEITPSLSFYGSMGPLSYELGGAVEITFKGDSITADIEASLDLGLEFPAKDFSWNIALSYAMDGDMGTSETDGDEEIENVITVSLETPFPFGFTPSLGGEYSTVYSTATSGNTEDILSFFIGLGYSKGIWSLGLIWQHGYDFQSSEQKGKYVIALDISL